MFNFFNLVWLLLRSCYLDSLVLGEIASDDANYTVPEQVDGEDERGATALLLPHVCATQTRKQAQVRLIVKTSLFLKNASTTRALSTAGAWAPAARGGDVTCAKSRRRAR